MAQRQVDTALKKAEAERKRGDTALDKATAAIKQTEKALRQSDLAFEHSDTVLKQGDTAIKQTARALEGLDDAVAGIGAATAERLAAVLDEMTEIVRSGADERAAIVEQLAGRASGLASPAARQGVGEVVGQGARVRRSGHRRAGDPPGRRGRDPGGGRPQTQRQQEEALIASASEPTRTNSIPGWSGADRGTMARRKPRRAASASRRGRCAT